MNNLTTDRIFYVKLYYKLRKYGEILKISFLTNTAYFTANLADGLVVFLRIWIFSQLYQVTYKTVGANNIAGFSVPMVVWTLMLVQIFSMSVRPSIARQIQDEIKDGTIVLKIARPYSHLFFSYFDLLGRFVSNLIINLFVGLIAVYLLVGPIKLTLLGFIFGLILLVIGLFIDFLISYLIGLCAFWMEDIKPLIWIYSKGLFVMGGAIFPIVLFPDYFRKIAELLPFSQIFYAASQIFVHFEPTLFKKYLATQICWLIIFFIFAIAAYKKGLKHVNVNGG